MSSTGIDDDDLEAFLLEHVDTLCGDDNRVSFGVAAVKWNSSFRRVLKKKFVSSPSHWISIKMK
jgi:hypothetical protein